MLDHVSITVADLAAAAPFYDAAMGALGVPCVWRDETGIGYGRRPTPDDLTPTYLSIRVDGSAAGGSRHWALRAPSRAAVRAFHAAAVAAGGSDDGAPGLRPQYGEHYYAAFVRDAAGNRIEAVCRLPGE